MTPAAVRHLRVQGHVDPLRELRASGSAARGAVKTQGEGRLLERTGNPAPREMALHACMAQLYSRDRIRLIAPLAVGNRYISLLLCLLNSKNLARYFPLVTIPFAILRGEFYS